MHQHIWTIAFIYFTYFQGPKTLRNVVVKNKKMNAVRNTNKNIPKGILNSGLEVCTVGDELRLMQKGNSSPCLS